MNNLLYTDFHCHSLNSDGKYSIQDVINTARQANIKYLAITDHNKILTDAEFEFYQNKNKDIQLIRGSDISSTFKFRSTKK